MNIILKLIDKLMSVINQLPENQRISQSPLMKSTPPKTKIKRTKKSVKPLSRQGRRGSETQMYNHPRD
jgi:hypothetical protein